MFYTQIVHDTMHHFELFIIFITFDQVFSIIQQPLKLKVANLLVESLFSIGPLFNRAKENARESMIEQGLKINVDWEADVKYLENSFNIIENDYNIIENKSLIIPNYYLKPFHAYDEGNLCWEAAFEVECAALTVHAPIYTPDRKTLRADGDKTLRNKFHENMLKLLFKENNFQEPQTIVDIGCSTGLSSRRLHKSFPNAEIIGVDLSAQMLAVGKFQLETRDELRTANRAIKFIHSAGENTGLDNNKIDMVSMCLIAHELPQTATCDIFREAHRILRGGGAITIMDIDPQSQFFQEFASNPFAFTAFKSTEPYIQEYVSLDIVTLLRECGFKNVQVRSNSPRHRTIVAYKD